MIAIARMTIREALRKKLLAAALLLAIVFLALFGTGLYFAGREIALTEGTPRFVRSAAHGQLTSFGFYLASFIMAFLAIFSAIGTISAEVENGLLHAIIPRPIRRIEIVLGKFIGHSVVIAGFGLLIFSAIAILVKMTLGFYLNNIPQALLLFILQAILLLAVSMLGTTFLPTLGNGVAVFLLYAVALIGGFVEQIGAMFTSRVAVNLGIVISLIMPSDAIYRKVVSLVLPAAINLLPQAMGPFASISTPSPWMIVYSIGHVIFVLASAIYIFNRRDI